MRRVLSVSCAVVALLVGLAVSATAQEIGQAYRSVTITQVQKPDGDQFVWKLTVPGDQDPSMASQGLKPLTELAQMINDGQHLIGAAWTQSAPGKLYELQVVMRSAAQSKPVLPTAVHELALTANCKINSTLLLKADLAFVKQLQSMSPAQIAKVMQTEEKMLKDDEKPIQQAFVLMTQLAAHAHDFPFDAAAKKIAFKQVIDGGAEFEIVFDGKYAEQKKIQAATISALQSQQKFAPIPVPQSKS